MKLVLSAYENSYCFALVYVTLLFRMKNVKPLMNVAERFSEFIVASNRVFALSWGKFLIAVRET